MISATVPDLFYRAHRGFHDDLAAICGDERRTYAEINERSNRLANALLGQGRKQGDRVAVLLENSIRCVEVDMALAKAGLVRVSINPRLSARDAEYIVRDSGATSLIVGSGFVETAAVLKAALASPALIITVQDSNMSAAFDFAAQEFEAILREGDPDPPRADFDAEHLHSLFYTSGTTGQPKGVMLSHRAIVQIAFNLIMETGPHVSGEKILLIQPLSHGSAFFVLSCLISGGAVVIMRHFDPLEVLRLAQEHEIETIKLVPTMLQRILGMDEVNNVKLPKLRQIIYGASPMPVEPLRQAIKIFGPRLVQIYGQSEAPATFTILPAEDHRADSPYPQRVSSAGRPWKTMDVRIMHDGQETETGQIGEVVVRGDTMMSGYWNRPELSKEVVRDGWLHTNDCAWRDEHGYIYLVGRKDEMINSGGYNIAPREVEEVLYEHPCVREAAVVGEADPEWGQKVVAYVVLGSEHIDSTDLINFTEPKLGFKRPRKIYVVPELPKNSNGKIQKSALTPDLAIN